MGRVKLYCRSVDRWGVGQNLYIYKQVQSCFTGKLNGRLRLLFQFSPRRPTLWAKKLSPIRKEKKFFHPSSQEKKFCLEGTKDISILQDFVKAKIEMCKSSAAFQSLRLPPTNWKKAVTDWYDEVGSSLIPIEQMIINRCGCSAEMMSSRLCSTQPSATTASLCGRKHTR